MFRVGTLLLVQEIEMLLLGQGKGKHPETNVLTHIDVKIRSNRTSLGRTVVKADLDKIGGPRLISPEGQLTPRLLGSKVGHRKWIE
jgi:hypothetical protein